MKKTIFLLTYNRPAETRRCLHAIKNAKGSKEYELVVVRQTGNSAVEAIIDDIDWIKAYHHVTNPHSAWSAARAINHNMYTGVSLSFEMYQSDFVVVVEDDVLIGFDFLKFCEQILKIHEKDPKFFAVNGFSSENYRADKLACYGKFRFGLGWGWAVHKNVWKNKMLPVWTGSEETIWDVHLEPTVRKGFVVMPFCSRVQNIGWCGSVHTSSNPDDPFYSKFRKSFVGFEPFAVNQYVYDPGVSSSWRKDCIRYDRWVFFKELNVKMFRKIKYQSHLRSLAAKIPSKSLWQFFNIQKSSHN